MMHHYIMPYKTLRALSLFISTCALVTQVAFAKANIVNLKEDATKNLGLTFDQAQLKESNIQSYSHFSHPDLQNKLLNTPTVTSKIKAIGIKKIEETIRKAIEQEIALSSTHYVFYHGCPIDFMFFQDILRFLSEQSTGKTLTDFFLLRVPSADLNHQSVNSFLKSVNYTVNDSYYPARNHLLSVNPALLGNNLYRETSSAFCYFLESKTAYWANTLGFISDAFSHYNASLIYKTCYEELCTLYYLLTSYEANKSGLLMQIFIPKKCIDNIAYRSLPRGVPFYKQHDCLNVTTSHELDLYQKNQLLRDLKSGELLDNMQFRILLSTNGMLSATNEKQIKIFRYFSQTPSTKQYTEKLEPLKIRIKQELNKTKKIK